MRARLPEHNPGRQVGSYPCSSRAVLGSVGDRTRVCSVNPMRPGGVRLATLRPASAGAAGSHLRLRLPVDALRSILTPSVFPSPRAPGCPRDASKRRNDLGTETLGAYGAGQKTLVSLVRSLRRGPEQPSALGQPSPFPDFQSDRWRAGSPSGVLGIPRILIERLTANSGSSRGES